MDMGSAPTWLRQVSTPPPASQNHFNHWRSGPQILQCFGPPACAAWWTLQAQTDHLHFVYFFHTDRWTDRQTDIA